MSEFALSLPVSKLVKDYGSPLYVYDENSIISQFRKLKDSIVYPKTNIAYACKANSNLSILKTLLKQGSYIDAVSPWEVDLALKAGFETHKILYTANNITKEEMLYFIEKNIKQNLGSLSQIKLYGSLNPSSDICVRINPDFGAGHHSHTITGGPESKFGIYIDKIDDIKTLSKEYKLNVKGIHAHIGSGILDYTELISAVDIILQTAFKFDDLDFIDIGGGLGIPYKEDENDFDVEKFGFILSDKFEKWCNNYGKALSLYLEPGRFIVGHSGVLLMSVVDIKETSRHCFVGTDSGFNHLIRPMSYGSYHNIINCSNPNGNKHLYTVAGNLCQSGDIFTQGANGFEGRLIPEVTEGDVLAICDAGAYGYSMASNYNLRAKPAEILFSDGKYRLIRRRENFDDIYSLMI